MGLTLIEENVEFSRKRAISEVGEPSSKRAKSVVDLKVGLHGSPGEVNEPRTMNALPVSVEVSRLVASRESALGKRPMEVVGFSLSLGAEGSKR